MKRVFYLFLLVFSFSLSGCTEFVQGMQSFTQGMGGQCIKWTCSSGYYDASSGKYLIGRYITKYQGKDISYKEDQWLRSREDACLQAGIGSYYYTSPYSNYQYKFEVLCDQWAQQ